jgi:flavin reductase (DIM6/NTAB) family NADH-FMN oxidoreductase RutF
VCLARSSSTLARLREARAFSISFLGARHRALAHRFSGHSGVQGPRRFDGAQWTTLSTGAPVLTDAIAAFDCLVEEVIERHSHAIVLGAVVSLKEGVDEPVLTRRRGEYAPSFETLPASSSDGSWPTPGAPEIAEGEAQALLTRRAVTQPR